MAKKDVGISYAFVNLNNILVESILLGFYLSLSYLIETICIFDSCDWLFLLLLIELGMVLTISSILLGFISFWIYSKVLLCQMMFLCVTFVFLLLRFVFLLLVQDLVLLRYLNLSKLFRIILDEPPRLLCWCLNRDIWFLCIFTKDRIEDYWLVISFSCIL